MGDADNVARDAIRVFLGEESEWRDDAEWWQGVIHIYRRLVSERNSKVEELAAQLRRYEELERAVEESLLPPAVISQRQWKESIRREAARRREAGALNMGELAKEAGISYSTLQRILNPPKRGGPAA